MSVTLSQGEATAIVVKAARGFGLSWGLAEEAGWALCQLGRFMDDPLTLFATAFADTTDQCPITLGATLMDHAQLPKSIAQIGGDLGHVRMPILLIPFLQQAAASTRNCLQLCERNSGTRISICHHFENQLSALQAVTSGNISITIENADDVVKLPADLTHRFTTSSNTLIQLDALCARTYVPETDASRASGAGSDQSDND